MGVLSWLAGHPRSCPRFRRANAAGLAAVAKRGADLSARAPFPFQPWGVAPQAATFTPAMERST